MFDVLVCCYGNYNDIAKDVFWTFEDYMTGEKHSVNPKIVHCMRSKNILIEYSKLRTTIV